MTRLQTQQMQAMAMEGQRLFSAGDARSAIRIFQQLHQVQPVHPGVNLMLGMCLASIAKHAEALPFLERAKASGASGSELVTAMATALRNLGRFEEAQRVLDDHLARQPQDWAALAAKADLLHFIDRSEEATALLEPALDIAPTDASLVLAYGRAAHDQKSRERAAALMTALRQDPTLPPRRRHLLLIRLGTVLDKLGRYDEAFEAFARGHALVQQPWNPAAHRATVDQVMQAWSAETLQAMPTSGIEDETPVFVVGMPRSGTTLIEQILDAHPKAFGAGELNDIHAMVFEMVRGPYLMDPKSLRRQSLQRLAERYLKHVRELAPDAARVCDKAPLNFRNVGLMALMFPKAKFVHALRDARDTCLSCYFQSIAGYFPQGHDLGFLGAFYNDHLRLMSHWKQVLPGRILDVQYEDVVDDLEGQTKRLLEFVGLEFDERCLRFWETGRVATTSSNDQVRKPLYKTSVARHERYAKFIAPLEAALAG